MLLEYQKGDFSTAQGLTAGTTASTNIQDVVSARHSLGAGKDMYIWIRTNVVESGADNDTYIFIFQQDTVENFASPTELFRISMTGDDARLQTAGRTIWCSTLPDVVSERYVRWSYVLADVGGTAAVTVDAGYGPARPPENRRTSQVYVSNVGDPS